MMTIFLPLSVNIKKYKCQKNHKNQKKKIKTKTTKYQKNDKSQKNNKNQIKLKKHFEIKTLKKHIQNTNKNNPYSCHCL